MNLNVFGNKVYSYQTHVATINGDTLEVNPKFSNYSKTTTKHINYVANEFNLKTIIK
jgi:hypothetical protein